MEYTLPTTKTQMYNTLREIYKYYRLQRAGYEPTSLDGLELTRYEFTPLDDDELTEKAEILVSASQEKEKLSYIEKLESEAAEISEKLEALEEKEQSLIDSIEEKFSESEDKVRAEAVKKGLSNSSVLLDSITDLESKMNAEIAKVEAEYAEKETDYNAKLTALQAKISGADEHFSALFSAEVNSKFLELKEEQDEKVYQVTKYNNGQSEKEQRSSNNIALANAELQIKYMELQTNSFTKEQLVEMGYYNDVAEVVTAYYNTLTPISAFQDFKEETQLAFYLEDFYPDFLYLYRTLAD